jgi:hypothetical protein
MAVSLHRLVHPVSSLGLSQLLSDPSSANTEPIGKDADLGQFKEKYLELIAGREEIPSKIERASWDRQLAQPLYVMDKT